MKREIKFRGQTTKKEWVYGSLYIGELDGQEYSAIMNNKTTSIAKDLPDRIDLAFDRGDVHIVYPATVGQYTGLKDNFGKEIYEGDIVICRYGYCGNPRYKTHEEIVAVSYRQGIHNIYSSDIYEFEIIGNIHDNPELLNGGRNE